jgi:hypothetical protein
MHFRWHVGVVGDAETDTTQPTRRSGMGREYSFDALPQHEIGSGDDAHGRTLERPAAIFGVARYGFDELRFTDRGELSRTIGMVTSTRLDEDGPDDTMTTTRLGEQVFRSPGFHSRHWRLGPDVMMGVDDWKLWVNRLLDDLLPPCVAAQSLFDHRLPLTHFRRVAVWPHCSLRLAEHHTIGNRVAAAHVDRTQHAAHAFARSEKPGYRQTRMLEHLM